MKKNETGETGAWENETRGKGMEEEESTSMRYRHGREQVKKSVEKGNADARVKLES